MVKRQIKFEFTALFHLPIQAVKKGGNFKINLLMDQMVSFLFCLCSRKKAIKSNHTIAMRYFLTPPKVDQYSWVSHGMVRFYGQSLFS